jgi:hypothetical protein
MRRKYTVKQLLKFAERWDRRAARARKSAKTLERKLAAAKKRKALAEAKKRRTDGR